MTEHIYIDQMTPGDCATVISVSGENAMKQRLEDIGVIPGTKIKCIMKSPLGDPVAYIIRGALIALRKEDSSKIKAELEVSEADQGGDNGTHS